MPPDQPGLMLHAPQADEEVRDDPAPQRPPTTGRPPGRERRPKIVVRRVRRVLRRFDPWSVLKVSLVFYICGYVVAMVAGVLLWNLAAGAGVVENVEDFIEDMGAFKTFQFESDEILQASLLLGGVLVVVATGLTVLAAVLFNLISDLVGGIRIVVLEEESVRPVAQRADSVPGSPGSQEPPGALAQSVRDASRRSDALGGSSVR